MKTSKKLLSFFLAVVMVVTSCSVGFTAFAAEKKKSIWNTSCEAEDAYATLNELANMLPGLLMGIDALSKPMYQKYAKSVGKTVDELTDAEKEEVKANATVADLLGVLQPTLLNALKGTSQYDYAQMMGSGRDAEYYDYLLKDDGSISFFTLYGLCQRYKDNGELSSETRETLANWLVELDKIADLDNPADANEAAIDELTAQFESTYEDGDDFEYTFLADIQRFYTDEFFATVDEDTIAKVKSMYPKYQQQLDNYGLDIKLDADAPMSETFPLLAYYCKGAGQTYAIINYYVKTVKDAGLTLNYTSKPGESLIAIDEEYMDEDFVYELTNITPDNLFDKCLACFEEEINGAYEEFLDDEGLEANPLATTLLGKFVELDSGRMDDDEFTEMLSYYKGALENAVFSAFTEIILPGCQDTIITALAIKNSDKVSSAADVEKLVNKKMPKAELTDDEIKEIASIMYNIGSNKDDAEIFVKGSLNVTDKNAVTVNAVLPAVLKNTAVADYFALVLSNSQVQDEYVAALQEAFYSEYFNAYCIPYYDLDGNSLPLTSATSENVLRNPVSNCAILNYDNATFDKDVINSYIDDARSYCLLQVVCDLMGNPFTIYRNIDTGVESDVDFEGYAAKQNKVKTPQIELNDEQKAILYGNYDLTGAMGAEIVNYVLNDTVSGILDPSSTAGGLIGDIVSDLLGGDVDLYTAIVDIWARITSDPVKTVFELLPLLVSLVESLVLPIVVNDTGTTYDNMIGNLAPTLKDLLGLDLTQYFVSTGSEIGITKLSFDLNKLLPDLMHWLIDGKNAQGITYYSGETVKRTDFEGNVINYKPGDIDTADVRKYTVKDQDGNLLSRTDDTFHYLGVDGSLEEVLDGHEDAVFTYEMTYSSDVPFLTGIYIADKALKDAELADLPRILGKALNNQELGTGLAEVIYELATLFSAALDEFVASDRMNQAKVSKTTDDGKANLVQSGLNQIFVAIPQLFDIMENLAAEKYGIPKNNWTYCYDGKIVKGDTYTVTLSTGEDDVKIEKSVVSTSNGRINQFKSLMASSDPNRSVDVLDLFISIFIEDWVDAILSLVNGVIATDNAISGNLPIISGLLNALGSFGNESIITDVLNGVFQLTRESEYSFTFAVQENGLTGLSKKNAYFLITNVERLIEVVKNLIAHFGGDSSDDVAAMMLNDIATAGVTDDAASGSSVVYKPKAAGTAKATSHKYSSDDLSNAKDLIGNLDKLLSSLLSDSTLNGFSLSSTENIIAGIVSVLDRFLGRDINLGNDIATDIVLLVNKYLYVITGNSENLTADNKQVDAKKVYSNDALTGLVVETYALIERIADKLLVKFYDTYDNDDELTYNLLVEAIGGVISPDAICVRLNDYSDAQKEFTKFDSWTAVSEAGAKSNYKNIGVNWGFKDGDKEAFYDGFTASLRLVSSILGVLLIETGWYQTVLTPVLAIFCNKNDIELTSYEELVADKQSTGYYDKTLIAVLSAVSGWLDALLQAPATTLIKTIQGLAGFLDEKNTKSGTIKGVLDGVMAPVVDELKGVCAILTLDPDNALVATSPTLAELVEGLIAKVAGLIDADSIKLGKEPYTYSLNGNNIIPIVNSYLASTGITLKKLSWSKIYSETPEGALVYVLEYAIETILDNDNLMALLELIAGGDNGEILATVLDALKTSKLDAVKLLGLINKVLEMTDSPTLAYWTFGSYLQELTESFKYPAGVTKDMANKGVDTLDNLVSQIFPLLSSFGVDLGADSLKGIVNDKLFTNELLTTIATALYGALDGLDPTVKTVLSSIGIVSSTADVAKLLTDASYGKTFTSAAKTIAAKESWSDVKNVNWGFTNGTSKAQQGFVNALVAILRPLDNVLAVFLNEGSLQLNNLVYDLICSLNVPKKSTTIDVAGNIAIKLTYSMSNGVFTLVIDDADRYFSKASTLKLNLKALKNLKDLKIVGTNGYNSTIIPLLETFKCSGIKTYSQYRSDVKSAKDNLLLDVLNPILGGSDDSLLNKLLDKPFATLTELLPNIAMFLDAHGLSQVVNNILAPVTSLVSDVAKTLNLNAVIKEVLGTDLGSLVADLLGVKVKINLDLTDLSKLNIEDLIVPIIRMVLAGLDNKDLAGLKIKDIDWNALISLGTKSTYTSKATGADGKFLTGKTLTNVDNGQVLITVLRYIADTLIDNMSVIKKLVLGIDAVKKNDIISSIVTSVFNTLSTASADQLIAAIFYLVAGTPKNAFWDYTSYQTGNFDFAYPEGMDVDFLKSLPPMIDGLVGGLADLNELIGGALFKDDLISKLATALYGAIEGVKIGDGTLTDLLAQTDIDFSTENVANLLVDKSYGQTFEGPASVIKNAGSWKNVKAESLKWGVTDRDSFFHALVAVLRPIYGVLDVLLNDAYLGLFDLVHIPGSNGYTSSIVPLMEAFSMYNIKTQYQYREDISKEYDAILLDIINPLWDKVEDILNAPLQTIAAVVPNLALFIGNDGLCQILDNLLAPISAIADAIRPIVDLNDLLTTLFKALNVDLNGILAKIGVTNFSLDVYDLNKTLKPILSGDAIIPLVNSILGIIKIKGTPLGLKLNDVNWLQLASHGTTIVSYSQAATYGARVYVEGDSAETLIAVLRYLVDTINTGDNLDKISALIGGLLGDGVPENISGIISQVLGMLKGDTDDVLGQLVELLKTFA